MVQLPIRSSAFLVVAFRLEPDSIELSLSLLRESSHRLSSGVRAYLDFHISLRKYGFITGLTWKLRYALTSKGPDTKARVPPGTKQAAIRICNKLRLRISDPAKLLFATRWFRCAIERALRYAYVCPTAVSAQWAAFSWAPVQKHPENAPKFSLMRQWDYTKEYHEI